MRNDAHGRPLNERHRKLMKTFADRLKAAREVKYGSAEQFAHTLAFSPHRYRKYERGQAEPNFETLTRICDLLGITPNDLFPDATAAGERTKRQRPQKAGKARVAA
jgi:transcriptional regulator with XRE-family HTH domain